MAPDARQRILQATYSCVARHGLAKTTVDDVARQSGLSRATIYRYFPGGRDQLVRDVISWETGRFAERMTAAVGGAGDLGQLLARTLVVGHRMVSEHEVLQKILETEPDRLLPQLTLEGGRVIAMIAAFIAPHVGDHPLPPGVGPVTAADYLARLLMSVVLAPGSWDLSDPEQVEDLVQVELLGGLSPPDGAAALGPDRAS